MSRAELYAAADDMAEWAARTLAPAVFSARCGRRRAYLSRADAMSYERGADAYPDGPIPTPNTPASSGWFDAEDLAIDRAMEAS